MLHGHEMLHQCWRSPNLRATPSPSLPDLALFACPALPPLAEIWSPAGGFYADPRLWKRNTVITVA